MGSWGRNRTPMSLFLLGIKNKKERSQRKIQEHQNDDKNYALFCPYFKLISLYMLGWVYTLSDVCFSERNMLIHGLGHTWVDLDVEVYGKRS